MLEVGGGIPAAFAARWMAGYGAEVVRVETDGPLGPLSADEAVYLLAGKRRTAVDGWADVADLAGFADIVIEDQAPGTLDVAALRAARPELCVVSVTPFGQSGPYAGYAVTNGVAFAMGGIMSLTGDIERTPLLTGGSAAFYLGGINAFTAALMAYYGRLVHSEGDWVDLSLQECAAGMVELYVPGTAYGQPVQLRTGNHVRAVWGIYPCIDGWAGAFCLERQIRGLFAAMDRPDLAADARMNDPVQRATPELDEELTAHVYAFFAGHTKAELLDLARRHKVPIGVATTPAELLDSPVLAARGYFESVETGEGSTARVPGRPFPGLGWRPSGAVSPVGELAAVRSAWSGAGS